MEGILNGKLGLVHYKEGKDFSSGFSLKLTRGFKIIVFLPFFKFALKLCIHSFLTLFLSTNRILQLFPP